MLTRWQSALCPGSYSDWGADAGGGRMDGEAPPPAAVLLVPFSRCADGAAETLSTADVVADASNYLTIPTPPLQKKKTPNKRTEHKEF